MKCEELKIPNHMGIIVDGNGRWATRLGKTRSQGHLEGCKNLERITKHAINKGVKYLSLYVFSTENFKREPKEVDYLMYLFVKEFKKQSKNFNKENIKVIFSGRREPLNKKVLEAIDKITELTKDNTKGTVNFCLNYGGQTEIIDAVNKAIKNGEEVTIESFNKLLYQDLPPLDFVIRTSGEMRISNFMLYQASYAEFYFPEVCFPDFDEIEFETAIFKYNKRDRRFGGINYERKNN